MVLLSMVKKLEINIQTTEEKSSMGIDAVIGGEEETNNYYGLCQGVARNSSSGSTRTHVQSTSLQVVNGELILNFEASFRFHRKDIAI